jgi:hypothetical protein
MARTLGTGVNSTPSAALTQHQRLETIRQEAARRRILLRIATDMERDTAQSEPVDPQPHARGEEGVP